MARLATSLLIVCCFAAPLAALDLGSEARRIDHAVDAALARAERSAGPTVDDLTFARRLVLDLGGRIPTPVELHAYLERPEGQRRTWLIDRVVGSPAWVSDRFVWWADLLRIQDRLNGRTPGQPYIDWVKARIADNTAYDDMVHALISAEGALWAEDNGAVGFQLRDQGMNEDHTALTVQAFLGTRIQCAQCHDHPDGTWSRKQFMQVAAFEHDIDTRSPILEGLDERELRGLFRDHRDDYELKRALRRMLQTVAAGVGDSGGEMRLPDDYQYEDAEPGSVVAAEPLWGVAIGDDRDAFATWVVGPGNEHFDLTIANRIWADLFGRGLVNPVDDFRPDNPSADEEVLLAVAELVRRADYDLELVYRVMTRTRAYQRQAVANPDPEGFVFAGPLQRRLSAEQIWDSLLALTVPDIDRRAAPPRADLRPFYAEVVDADERRLITLARQSEVSRENRRDANQAIYQARRELAHAQRQGNDHAIARAQAKLDRALATASQVMVLSMSGGTLPFAPAEAEQWRGLPPLWVRASELPQPMRPDHVLRSFGQSDRETLNAASTEPTVPQALALMNGLVDEMVLSPRSALQRSIAGIRETPALVDALYRSILFRAPNPDELSAIRAVLGGQDAERDVLAADLVWALINHSEFLHQR